MERRARPIFPQMHETNSSSSRSRRWVAPQTASWLLKGRTLKIMNQSHQVASAISNRINHRLLREAVRDLPQTSAVATFHRGLQPSSHLHRGSALPRRLLSHESLLGAPLIEWCWPLLTRLIRGWWQHGPPTSPQPVQKPVRLYTITTKTKANLTWHRNIIIR